MSTAKVCCNHQSHQSHRVPPGPVPLGSNAHSIVTSAYLEGGDVGNGPVGGAGVPVATSDDAEEAVLAPVGAPGVAADPEVHTVLSAPAVDLNGVVGGLGVAGVVHVDAAGVGLNAVGVQVGGHRAASVDLRHNVVVALHGAVLGQGDLRVVGHGICEQACAK